MARLQSVISRMKMGRAFSQTAIGLGRSGSARSGRRESNGPDPSRGGGTRGRIMRSGEVEVDDERDNVLGARMEDVSRRDCECRIECRIDGGRLESCLSPKGEVI